MPALPDGVDGVAVCLLHADLDPAHEQAVAAAAARAGPRRQLLARGLARGARVRAHGHHGRERRPAPAVPRLPARHRRRRRRGARHDLGRRAAARGRRGRPARPPCCCRVRPAACGRRRRWRWPTASPTPSPSTWAARAPTSASCSTARPRRPPSDRSAATPCGSRRSTSTPSAPAAARSPTSIPGGALLVGPRSAGADPGPACYGRGGTEPTVTDADLVAGRIPADAAFGGLALDRDGGRAGAGRRRRDRRRRDPGGRRLDGASAAGGVGGARRRPSLAGAGRLRRRRTAARLRAGRRPRHGGGDRARRGPACCRRSACSRRPIQRDLVRSWPTPLDHTALADARRRLAAEAAKLVGPRRRTTTTAVDCRYAGQSHELTVSSAAAFHEAHQQRNGFSRPDAPVEVVADPGHRRRSRAASSCPTCRRRRDHPPRGPVAIAEPDCTIWLPDGWTAEPGAAGALVLRRTAMTLDAAGLQVLMSRLGGIADEMGAVLRRSASSPNIKERADCSAAVFDAAGELLAQAEHIPVHLGSMPASVRAAIDAYGGWLEPGDHVVRQRPVRRRHPPQRHHRGHARVRRRARARRLGGQPRAPRRRRRRRARLDPRRRHRDPAGGPAHPADALHRGAARTCCSPASRTPDERAGDLDAQIGANVVGFERLVALG